MKKNKTVVTVKSAVHSKKTSVRESKAPETGIFDSFKNFLEFIIILIIGIGFIAGLFFALADPSNSSRCGGRYAEAIYEECL